MQISPERFAPAAVAVVEDGANELLLSPASCWEIAIKSGLGKLPLPMSPAECVPSRLEAGGVLALPVSARHALHVATLPPHHRDPVDRLLVAQAQLQGLRLLAVDRQLSEYDVSLLPAV
jgi:PIN domain nuclease of toxin-antitoxin system